MDILQIIATTGWRTFDLQLHLNAVYPTGFNLVSLLIGVNKSIPGWQY